MSSTGRQANFVSEQDAVSRHGRYVAFVSGASNLVAGDTNGVADVFVRDRLAAVTRRVSVGLAGRQADDTSHGPAISADGRFVAFMSFASNLVAGDTNRFQDVFVRDQLAGVTRRVSVGPGGRQANSSSQRPVRISADGRFVAFTSSASNLVRGDTNGVADVFVRDLLAGVTRRVSVGPGGRQADGGSGGAAISADGRFVAFGSAASNLVRGDTNGFQDVLVRDLLAGVTRRVSVGLAGRQADGSSFAEAVSADGRFVAFTSFASNLVRGDTNGVADVFVRDLLAGVTRRVSVGPGGRQADDGSGGAAISADGRFVAFGSDASNLVRGDTNGFQDVFVRDLLAGVTRRVSVGSGGQGNSFSSTAAISPDGRSVAFTSFASNLVAGDTNGVSDVFVRDQFGDVG